MVSARRRGRGVEIAGFGRIATPEGCVKNGIVVNSSQLGEALARVARENGLRGKRMCLAVTSPAISFRELEVPAAKPRDLDRILAEEAAHLSVSKQESLMDYVLLGETEREGKRFFRAWCAVTPRSLVDGYRDAVRKAGFSPEAFDVASNAAFKAFQLDRDLSREETVICAGVREDELCLSLFGGEDGTRLYREAQVAAPKSPVENEYILSSLVPEAPDAESRQERLARAATAQLSRLVQFQMMHDKRRPVRRIFLCSDLSDDPRLAGELRETLRVDTAPAAAPGGLRCPGDFPYSEYLYAVGAAIRL